MEHIFNQHNGIHKSSVVLNKKKSISTKILLHQNYSTETQLWFPDPIQKHIFSLAIYRNIIILRKESILLFFIESLMAWRGLYIPTALMKLEQVMQKPWQNIVVSHRSSLVLSPQIIMPKCQTCMFQGKSQWGKIISKVVYAYFCETVI